MHNVLSSDVNEHCEGARHLTVPYKRVFLHVVVPHLHKILLAPVDVREVVNHLAGLDPQPLRVWVILLVFSVKNRVRWNWQTRGAEDEITSSLRTRHVCKTYL